MAFIRIEVPNEIMEHFTMAGGMVPRLTLVDDLMPSFTGTKRNPTRFTDALTRALVSEVDGASHDLVKTYKTMIESGELDTLNGIETFAEQLSDLITTTVALGLAVANKHITISKGN